METANYPQAASQHPATQHRKLRLGLADCSQRTESVTQHRKPLGRRTLFRPSVITSQLTNLSIKVCTGSI